MNQLPVKNDTWIPDTVGSVHQPSDSVTKAELFHMVREINDNTKVELFRTVREISDNTKTELLDSVKRASKHLKTELYDAIYKVGELILSTISEGGLSSTAARQEPESESP